MQNTAVDSGAVAVAESPGEMRDLIVSGLTKPQAHSSERKRLIQEMFGPTLDGKSSQRVAEVLLELADKGRSARR